MSLSQEQIEYLHSTGRMPDWIYYQQNGKTATENYNEQHRNMIEQLQNQYLSIELDKQIDSKIEKAVEDVLKGLNTTFDFQL